MKRSIVALMLAIAVGLFAPSLQAKIIGVDTNFNSSTPGWGVTNFNSVASAVTAAVANDTIQVAAGIYTQKVVLNKALNLVGVGATETTLNGGNSGKVVTITASNVKLSGFTITGSGATPLADFGVYLQGVSGCVVENCTVSDNNGVGIGLVLANNNSVTGNTVSNNSIAAIGLLGCANNTITENRAMATRGYSNYGYGIILDNQGSTYSTGNVVSGNTCSGNVKTGIYLGEGSRLNTLTGNRLESNGEQGLYIWKSNNNTVTDNTVTNNTLQGIKMVGSAGNTLTANAISGSATGLLVRSYYALLASNNTIQANSFIATVAGVELEANPDSTMDDSGLVDVSANYWGASDGPFGSGSPIIGALDISSYYTDAEMTTLNFIRTVNQALVGDVTSSVAEAKTSVPGGSFTATYTATNGWISSVYTNGAPAYDCSAKPTEVTLSLTGITSAINIVVATSKARPSANTWYENPGLKNDFAQVPASKADGCAGFHWGMDATDDFLAAPIHFTGQNSTLYSVASLESGSTNAINTYVSPSLFSADVRGAAVSKPLNVQLVGSSKEVGYILSLPLNESSFVENENAYKIYTSNGTTPDAMNFTADGQYLYTSDYGAGANGIYKYQVLNGLKSSGTNLVLVSSWDLGIRVRHMTVARMDGKDIVYIQSESALYVLDTSSTSNSKQSLGVTAGNKYANIAVGGIGAGTPRLYAFSVSSLQVFTIKTDYTVETTPYKSYTSAQLGAICGYDSITSGNGTGLAVTDDEATLFLGANTTGPVLNDRIFVIQYVAPVYPDWILNCGLTGEDLVSMEGKYTAWAATQTVTDLMTTDYSAQFLMNADAEETVALAITAISLDTEGNVTLAIQGLADAVTLDLAAINGVLYLSTAAALDGAWNGRTFGPVSANIGGDGIAVPEFAGSNGFFFKAAVNFAAPEGSTDLAAPVVE